MSKIVELQQTLTEHSSVFMQKYVRITWLHLIIIIIIGSLLMTKNMAGIHKTC